MAFWDDATSLEPKRAYRFLVSIAGATQSLENYVIKKVTKPGFEVSESEHKFLSHTFYYPGKVTWKEVTFELVDLIDPNGSKKFLEMLEEAGYRAPEGPVEAGLPTAQTLSKKRSIQALGQPIIRQIDADGNTTEEWVLKGAWVKNVEFGELDYEGEDLMAISVTIRYDYAYCNFKQPENKRLPTNAK